MIYNMSGYHNLAKILNEEVEHYKNMLTLVEKTQQSLIDNDIEQLNKLLSHQQILIVESGKLEEKRAEEMAGLANAMDLPVKDITLSKIIEAAPEQKKKTFELLQASLTDTVEKIKSLNNQNEELIKDSLNYINNTMKLFTETEEKKTYDGKVTDEVKRETVTRIFDKRV